MNEPRSQTLPIQMLSCKQRPQISPVPKVIVTSSRGAACAQSAALPSQLTSFTVEECDSSNFSCAWHASLLQSFAGTSKFPDPVSKTTANVWAGLPICKLPKYAVL